MHVCLQKLTRWDSILLILCDVGEKLWGLEKISERLSRFASAIRPNPSCLSGCFVLYSDKESWLYSFSKFCNAALNSIYINFSDNDIDQLRQALSITSFIGLPDCLFVVGLLAHRSIDSRGIYGVDTVDVHIMLGVWSVCTYMNRECVSCRPLAEFFPMAGL